SDDMCLVTADHGNDPTTPSTDHSREYVPLLIAGPRVKPGVALGTRETFADVAATLSDFFDIRRTGVGRSFLREVRAGSRRSCGARRSARAGTPTLPIPASASARRC